jgi:hypothetical protein
MARISSERIPGFLVDPILEPVPALVFKDLGPSEVEPRIELMNDLF